MAREASSSSAETISVPVDQTYEDIDWSRASCRDADLVTFFPTSPYTGKKGYRYRKEHPVPEHVERMCLGCPIYPACLTWSLRHEEYGIWAGLGVLQRKALRERLGIRYEKASVVPRHYKGTSVLTSNARYA